MNLPIMYYINPNKDWNKQLLILAMTDILTHLKLDTLNCLL